MAKPHCPNCKSNATMSAGCLTPIFGILVGFVGLFIWPLLLLAIPLIFMAPLMMILEKTGKFTVPYYCTNCKSQFKVKPKDKTEK